MFRKQKLKPYVIFFSGTLLFLLVGIFVYRHFSNKSEPLLSVKVRTSSALLWGGKEEYYIVRNNGVLQKCETIIPSEVESYRVDEMNNDYSEILIDSKNGKRLSEDSPLYEIVNDIIEALELKDQIKNPDIYKIYILGERYFFNVFDDSPSFPAKFHDIIYEYIPEDRGIVEITKFNSKNIEHIELYNSETFETLFF